jgi:tRNA(Ile)-lysidine synthase
MIHLPPDAVSRFRRDCRALTEQVEAPLLVALSGGPDSSALLLLAHAALRARVHAATVDHGLRPQSRQEAEDAARLCVRLGVPHAILSGHHVPRVASGNLQALARAVRYAALEAHADAIGARWIATAHHADDQLETMLMRLNRASGVAGLAGIRAVEGRRIRPLLGWRRAELAAIVARAGVVPAVDPSNSDDRFDRARLRKQLAEVDWLDPLAAAASAAALQQAEGALAWTVERLVSERIAVTDGRATLDPQDLPAELRRRLALRAIESVQPDAAPRGEALARLIAALEEGEQAMVGDVLAVADGGCWTFRRAPPRRRG